MTRDAEGKGDPKTARLYDKRTVERNIKKGLLTRKDYEKHLKTLRGRVRQGRSTARSEGRTPARARRRGRAAGPRDGRLTRRLRRRAATPTGAPSTRERTTRTRLSGWQAANPSRAGSRSPIGAAADEGELDGAESAATPRDGPGRRPPGEAPESRTHRGRDPGAAGGRLSHLRALARQLGPAAPRRARAPRGGRAAARTSPLAKHTIDILAMLEDKTRGQPHRPRGEADAEPPLRPAPPVRRAEQDRPARRRRSAEVADAAARRRRCCRGRGRSRPRRSSRCATASSRRAATGKRPPAAAGCGITARCPRANSALDTTSARPTGAPSSAAPSAARPSPAARCR